MCSALESTLSQLWFLQLHCLLSSLLPRKILDLKCELLTHVKYIGKKNPAYGRHQLCRPMRIVGQCAKTSKK